MQILLDGTEVHKEMIFSKGFNLTKTHLISTGLSVRPVDGFTPERTIDLYQLSVDQFKYISSYMLHLAGHEVKPIPLK